MHACSNTDVVIISNGSNQIFGNKEHSAYFCSHLIKGEINVFVLIHDHRSICCYSAHHQHYYVINLCFFQFQLDILEYRLTVLFHCAHRNAFIFPEFGINGAIDCLAHVVQSPAAQTRLLARLVICCLLPILEDRHMTLLKLTDEESRLLLTYVKEVMLLGGLDRAKFLMAASILYSDVCPQNASELLAITLAIAETVVQQIFKQHDNCVLEGTLCLLWTLCHTPAVVQRLSQIDHFIPELKTIKQTRCSTVSSLAKCVLWKLGCGNYEGNVNHLE